MEEREEHSRGAKRTRRYGGFDLAVGERRLHFRTQPGVFSQDGPDEGSMLLIEALQPSLRPHWRALDLGCGVGVLGLAIAGSLPRGEVWLVDSDIRAVRLSEENVHRNRIDNAHVLLGDITLDLPRIKFDLVLSNPPTHGGKDVLASFVRESYDVLKPGGWLYLVVNRLLSVRDMMSEAFGNVEQVERRRGFIVFRAQKARRRGGSDPLDGVDTNYRV